MNIKGGCLLEGIRSFYKDSSRSVCLDRIMTDSFDDGVQDRSV